MFITKPKAVKMDEANKGQPESRAGASIGEGIEKEETMKRRIAVFMVFIFLIGLSTALAGEPYAPKVSLPDKNHEDYAYWEFKIGPLKAPGRDEVPIPPYPGARVMWVSPTGTRTARGETRVNPRITLITPDGRDKVVAFYKERLKGWKYKEEPGHDLFWDDGEYFSPMMADAHKRSSVVLFDIGGPLALLQELVVMPDAKTKIDVTYKPSP